MDLCGRHFENLLELRCVENLAHERQQILFGVAKEGHPQVVIRHFCDHVGLVLEAHSAGKHLAMGSRDIRHREELG